ncbi:MAG: hypothetical protein DLM72_18010 [Candidatus Nitrosopolaris wilkensis]|nr:MAG: hypothetical protein DLM72_18010 [Candidatus Nitrosopolaris wilkensis]
MSIIVKWPIDVCRYLDNQDLGFISVLISQNFLSVGGSVNDLNFFYAMGYKSTTSFLSREGIVRLEWRYSCYPVESGEIPLKL